VTDEIWTIKELAAHLRVKEKTAYALAARGDIPGFKVGGSWRFSSKDIETWIKRQTENTGIERRRSGAGNKRHA
jgi:excisionase family DNA binding protein